jgi:hypothetical protein
MAGFVLVSRTPGTARMVERAGSGHWRIVLWLTVPGLAPRDANHLVNMVAFELRRAAPHFMAYCEIDSKVIEATVPPNR